MDRHSRSLWDFVVGYNGRKSVCSICEQRFDFAQTPVLLDQGWGPYFGVICRECFQERWPREAELLEHLSA